MVSLAELIQPEHDGWNVAVLEDYNVVVDAEGEVKGVALFDQRHHTSRKYQEHTYPLVGYRRALKHAVQMGCPLMLVASWSDKWGSAKLAEGEPTMMMAPQRGTKEIHVKIKMSRFKMRPVDHRAGKVDGDRAEDRGALAGHDNTTTGVRA